MRSDGGTTPRPPSIGTQQSRPFLRSGVSATPVPESDSGMHEKRYCCVGPEIPHKRVAKIAPVARKAVGCQSSALGTLIEGNLARLGAPKPLGYT